MRDKPLEFLDLLDCFLNTYLPCSVGVSPNTIKSYKSAFRLLLKYMYEKKGIIADKIGFADLKYEALLDFLSWLETGRGCSITTRNQRLSALSSFAQYAQNRDFDAATVFRRSTSKVPSKKGINKPRSVFTLEEIAVLLNLPKNDSATGCRNRTLLSVMYATGARAQEICDLRVPDVRFNGETATLTLTGKGNKTRRVGIPSGCAALLKYYIEKQGLSGKNARHVFSSQTREHMSVSCIEEVFKKYIGIARDECPNLFCEAKYTPHSMRHSTATHMLEAGVSIVVIKNILGHVSLQSTQRYATTTQSTLNKHIRAWNDKWGPVLPNIEDEPEMHDIIPDFLKNK
jgi:site-specific recombinase XerD